MKDLARQFLALPQGDRQGALQRLPSDVGSKVLARLHDRDKAIESFTNDPFAFVRQVAEVMAAETMEQSAFAARFRDVESQVKRSLAERFVADNKLAPAELGELHKLVAGGMPHNMAVQWIARERELAALKGSRARSLTRSARSTPTSRRRGRSSRRRVAGVPPTSRRTAAPSSRRPAPTP